MNFNIVFFHIFYESHIYFVNNYNISLYKFRFFASFKRIDNIVVKIVMFSKFLNVFATNYHDIFQNNH